MPARLFETGHAAIAAAAERAMRLGVEPGRAFASAEAVRIHSNGLWEGRYYCPSGEMKVVEDD